MLANSWVAKQLEDTNASVNALKIMKEMDDKEREFGDAEKAELVHCVRCLDVFWLD